MGDEIVEKLKIEGDSTSAQKAAQKAEKSLTKSFFNAQIAANIATKAFALANEQIRAGVEAALENERTTIRLQTALQVQGREVEQNSRVLAAQASQLENVSGISDEVIRKFQGQAVNLGVATEEVDKYIRASIALANATGKDVNTAFEQVIKSTSGVAEETLKLVPEIRELTKEELAAGAAADVLVEKFGGLVDLETQGASGEITKMTNAIANLAEEIGIALIGLGKTSGLFTAIGEAAQTAADIIASFDLRSWLIGGADMEALISLFNEYRASQRRLASGDDFLPPLVGLGGKPVGAGKPGKGGKPGPVGGLELVDIPANFISLEGARAIGQAGMDPEAQRRADAAENWELMKSQLQAQAEEQAAMEADAANERIRIAQDEHNRKLAMTNTFATSVASVTNSLFQQMIDGERIRGAEVVTAFLKNTGMQIFGRGLFDIAIGSSRALMGDPTGAAQVAHGTNEVAIGGAMAASGAIIGNAFGVGGGGGGGGRGGASSGGQATAFGRTAPAAASGGEPRNITIVFNGPTTAAQVGVAINDALGAARSEGLLV